MNIINKAEIYACNKHGLSYHWYDVYPYRYHLQMTVDFAERFIYLIPEEDRDNVIAGCWCHDVIEDTRVTYNDVKENTNEIVAEYAYALTNEKGRNRKERVNEKYYNGIKSFKHASFIKLCDRLANATFSKSYSKNRNKMFLMYKSEYKDFKEKLDDGRWDEMWKELDTILNNSKKRI